MYNKPFYIIEKVSNNAFNFEKRINPQIFVPSLKLGTLKDIQIGNKVVFEDFDDNGKLQSCIGLEHFIKIKDANKPIYIFDNHNHAFYFWCEEFNKGTFGKNALLIHVDQHKDNRIPPNFLNNASDLHKVFTYTNTDLNVGNFIPAAQHLELIKEIIFLDSEYSLENIIQKMPNLDNMILDIDLDFFVPEFDYIGNKFKLEVLSKLIPQARMITFATSPFFIDQKLALKWLNTVLSTQITN